MKLYTRAFIIEQDGLHTTTKAPRIPDDKRRIQLHATTRFSVDRDSKATTQPMADNSDRADHYRNNSVVINLEGYVADSTVIDSPTDSDGNVLEGYADININTYIGGTRISSEEYIYEIQKLQNEKRLVTVVLPTLGMYGNCVITSFKPAKETSVGKGVRVSLKLQQLLVATVGKFKAVTDTFEDQNATKQDKGAVDVEGLEQPLPTYAVPQETAIMLSLEAGV